MPGVLSLMSTDTTRRKIIRRFKFVPSTVAGQGYTTGGETLDFTAALNPNGLPRRTPPSNPLPGDNDFRYLNAPGGYDFQIFAAAASPTLKNFVLKFFSSGGTELAQADYPALLKGQNCEFDVVTQIGH